MFKKGDIAMSKKPKYYYCASFNDLVNLVAGHIRDYDTGIIKNFGTLTVNVEDVPYEDEGTRMTQEQLAEAYGVSTGSYGVTAVDPFTQDTTTVLVGYYCGNEVRCFTVDGTLDMGKYLPALRQQVKRTLTSVLRANCDDGANNFLVEIK